MVLFCACRGESCDGDCGVEEYWEDWAFEEVGACSGGGEGGGRGKVKYIYYF